MRNSSVWTDPFIGFFRYQIDGQGDHASPGFVIRVGEHELLFQVLQDLPMNLKPLSIEWGEQNSIPLRITDLSFVKTGPCGSAIYRLHAPLLEPKMRYAARKNEQLALALLYDHQDRLTSALKDIRFPYDSIMDVKEGMLPHRASMESTFLGKTIQSPFYVAGMTGGSSESNRINNLIASAASEFGIPMAVGSQRWVLEKGASHSSKNLRQQLQLPEALPLIGNLGISEVLKGGTRVLQRLAEETGVDAIAIHLNILQELMQREGERHFQDSFSRLHGIVEESSVPILLKETGCGFSPALLKSLLSWKIEGIELTSNAGTNWTSLEGRRSANAFDQCLAADFAEVGHDANSQLTSLLAWRSQPNRPKLIASGGIERGIHVAKWLYAGADLCSIGRGALRVLFQNDLDVASLIDYFKYIQKSIVLGMTLAQAETLEDFKGAWQPSH